MAFRSFGLTAAAATAIAATLAMAGPAYAVTEIQWWHAMTGGNNDVIVKLANDFNAAQSDYKVVPTYKGGYADTMNAGIAAFRAGNAPHILQVFEVGTATMMAATGAVKPVYKLMQETGEPFDAKAYLPAITGYYSTSKGEMLSFPFNSSSMVMWVNLDALKKADIAEIPKTWPEVFEDAKKLKAAGYATCGFSTAWVTWANLEQLSAWHNVPLASKANGLDGFDTKLAFNGPVQLKHLQKLIELQKDKTYDYSGRTNTGEGRFTSGECPLFLTSSGFFGNVKSQAKFTEVNENLGRDIAAASALSDQLKKQLGEGDNVLRRLSKIVAAARPGGEQPAAAVSAAQANAAAAQAFAERRRHNGLAA
jgi:sn-glycerol 3-phosphate transport system substrate-binding protein